MGQRPGLRNSRTDHSRSGDSSPGRGWSDFYAAALSSKSGSSHRGLMPPSPGPARRPGRHNPPGSAARPGRFPADRRRRRWPPAGPWAGGIRSANCLPGSCAAGRSPPAPFATAWPRCPPPPAAAAARGSGSRRR